MLTIGARQSFRHLQFQSILRGLALPCLIACVVAAACSGSSEVAPGNPQSMQTVKHPSGFAVRFDSGTLSATQTARGFQFLATDAATRRSPSTIELTLEPGTQPPGEWPESRDLEGRSVRYRIDSRPGGSGGDLFVLNAWFGCSAHHVLVRQDTQAETPAEVDFSQGWSILVGATCPA